MSKWKVALNGAGGWQVFGTDGRCVARFHTHAEALEYADRRARTVEVELPRAAYGDKVIAGKGLYSLHVNHMSHCTDVTLGGWDGVTVENRHLWDLAVYLAACAKHWEETQ